MKSQNSMLGINDALILGCVYVKMQFILVPIGKKTGHFQVPFRIG